MPVSDQEPRYRLVDANDNIIGSVYAEADGTLKLQEGSGSNNEAAFQPDGTLDVPAVSADDEYINGAPNITTPAGARIPSTIQTPSGNIALALAQLDQSASPGSAGAKAAIGYFASSGEQIAQTDIDSDLEYNIYTRDADLSSATDLIKRFNIDAGVADTNVSIGGGIGNTTVRVAAAEAGKDATLSVGGSTGVQTAFRWNAGPDVTQMVDIASDRVIWQFNNGFSRPAMDWGGTGHYGLREISNPVAGDLLGGEWAWDSTNSRWLFKDSGGTMHNFTPDGAGALEFGVETLSGPAAASDGSWDTFNDVTTTVSFDSAYNSTPAAVASYYETGLVGMNVNVTEVGTNDISLRLINYSTSDYSTDSFEVAWIAVGDKS